VTRSRSSITSVCEMLPVITCFWLLITGATVIGVHRLFPNLRPLVFLLGRGQGDGGPQPALVPFVLPPTVGAERAPGLPSPGRSGGEAPGEAGDPYSYEPPPDAAGNASAPGAPHRPSFSLRGAREAQLLDPSDSTQESLLIASSTSYNVSLRLGLPDVAEEERRGCTDTATLGRVCGGEEAHHRKWALFADILIIAAFALVWVMVAMAFCTAIRMLMSLQLLAAERRRRSCGSSSRKSEPATEPSMLATDSRVSTQSVPDELAPVQEGGPSARLPLPGAEQVATIHVGPSTV